MKKIIISLSIVGAIAAVVVYGTTAFFSDEEVSQNNTFTAGAIDLKVDSECSYNGSTSTQCGTWTMKDLEPTADQFFKFTDVKPGDFGENTIGLQVTNNDAWVCAAISGVTDSENGRTEPEALVDTTDDTGELSSKLEMTIWRDTDGDNVQDSEETVLYTGNPKDQVLALYDSSTHTGALTGGSTGYLGIKWDLPANTGNEVQTDSMTADISFNVVQSRNNDDFRCVAQTPQYTLVTGASLVRSWDAEARHGKLGAADWELGIGLNTQGADQHNNLTGTDLYNWPQDVAMPFTLTYDKSTGVASMTIRDVEETYNVGTSVPANSKLAIYLGASSGVSDSTTLQNLVLNSTPISGSVVATAGGTASNNISGFDFSQSFTLTGEAVFNYTGTTGSRPGFSLTIGQ
ncbi:MAG: CalY family protein [Patescibacteria group bacterium]|nr:CalY family protein [Patescibacteria group bacterium]